MIGALIFNIIAVFFAWLQSNGGYKHGLKLSLFTVFIFLALRYDYGNDYMGYLENFLDINKSGVFRADLFIIKGNELGWFYLNRLFDPLGFFAMTAFLAALSCYVLFRFIKKYVPPQYYWFAVFLYVFKPTNMLVLSSAMRQEVAGVLFLLSIDYIIQKKVIKYLILIYIATLFHTSAVFLFPFILLGFINWKIKFYQIILVFAIFILPIIFTRELYDYIQSITRLYFDYYSVYLEEDFENSKGLGFAYIILSYLIAFYFSQNDNNKENNLLYKIAIISMLIVTVSFGVLLISRINLYLYPVMMAVFPIVFTKIKNAEFRFGYISVNILYTIYQFFVFFQSELWGRYFGEYHTIFSVPGLFN